MSIIKKLSGAIGLLMILVSFGYAQTSTMLWNAGPNLQFPRDSGAAVRTADGSIYVLGGNTTIPTSVESLPFNGTAWTNATSLPTARLAPGASLFDFTGTTISVFGGKTNNKAVKDAVNYNPAGANGALAGMNSGRYSFAFAGDTVGNLYAMGGKDANERLLAATERFIPSTGRWAKMVDLPEARFNFCASVGNGGLLTFGGSTAASVATNNVYRFDGAVWTALAPMPVATSGSAVVVGQNNLLYVVGGTGINGNRLNNVQIYNTVSGAWQVGTPLPVGVSNASVVLDSFLNLVVIGGINSSNQSVSSVWTSPQESAPPVFTSYGFGGFIAAGTNFTYQATAQGNPAPTFALTVAPAGMTISNGSVSWTPTLTQIGTFDVTVQASNPSGSVDQSFQITVTPPPVTGFTASNITANTLSLSWNQSPAELGAVTYNLFEVTPRGGRGGGFIYTPLAIGTTATAVDIGGLGAGTGHSYAVSNVVNGAESVRTLVRAITLVPASPTNLIVSTMTQNSVTLSWTAPATSQVPVIGYRVAEFVLGVGIVTRIDNTADTTATISGLLANSTHIFYVYSLDANLNQSFPVQTGNVLTNSIPTIIHNAAFPRAVGGGFYAESVVAVNGDRLMVISTEAQSSAGVDYTVSGSGLPAPTFSLVSAPAGMTIDAVTGVVSWTNVNAAPGSYTQIVRASNVEGSSDLTFNYTVYPAGTDLLSPTANQNFLSTATNITRTSATISWAASTDNVGVVGYRIFVVTPLLVCGTRTGCPPLPTIPPFATTSGTGTSVTITGLTRATTYSFWIQAVDAAGNTSFITQGIQRSFTTLP
jgi:Fibronectin type III domain/Putative Ig domain/Kelch motif